MWLFLTTNSMEIKFKKISILILLICTLSYAQVYLPEVKKLKWEDIPRPDIWAKRITHLIKIDGYLNDKGWEEAAVDSLIWEVCPNSFSYPEERTKFFVGYDNENLYFGFICYEKDISQIRATKVEQRERYKAIPSDDLVRIWIGTDTTKQEVYSFVVTPYGVHNCLYVKPMYLWEEIDILWYTDAKILDSCWTAEFAIPFKSLKFTPEDTNCFRLLVGRSRPREVGYSYSWTARPCGFGYDPIQTMGKLYISEKIEISKGYEILPYFTGSLEKEETLQHQITSRIGLTGKYYLTYTNIFDFTVNPDYSQIETDAPQIDVNTTSAIYYEEKRPFFLEGKEIFETPFEIFYTRTINTPLFALKFHGDIKDFKIAYLTGFDRYTPWIIPFPEYSLLMQSDKKSISNIFRIKKNFLKGSYVGLLITDRELKKSFSRIFVLDGNFIFKNCNHLTYQGTYTWTKEPDDINLSYEFDGETLYGKGFYINFRHQSPKYYLNLEWKGLSAEFRADNGYIQYNDYEKREGKGGIYFLFKKNSFIQSIFPQVGIKELRRFLKGRYYLNKNAFININFRNLISAGVGYMIYSHEYRDVNFKKLWNYTLSVSSLTLKNFHLFFYLKYGREINYYSYPLKAGYVLYPSINLNIYFWNLRFKLSYSRYMMWEEDYKDRVYNQEVASGEVVYLFSRFTAFKVINQYSSTTGEYFVYPLFSFELTPFTLFYLGSNHTFIKESKKYEQKDFKIFLKIQYQFRF